VSAEKEKNFFGFTAFSMLSISCYVANGNGLFRRRSLKRSAEEADLEGESDEDDEIGL